MTTLHFDILIHAPPQAGVGHHAAVTHLRALDHRLLRRIAF
jgi:hypothetical protein